MMKADHEAAMKFARLGAELFRVHHDPKSPNTLKPEVMHEANLSKAYLEIYEQLAAEQEKVKALQPYKDAYEDGQDMFALYENETFRGMYDSCGEAMNDCHARNAEEHPHYPWSVKTVRVCKVVSPESTVEMVKGDK